MVYALGVLLVFQLGGEVLGRLLGLPVPGPVLGMVGLVVAFVMVPGLGARVQPTAQGLLAHLSLLFVPAGVGVVAQIGVLGAHGGALLAALVISTVLAIAAGALTFVAVARLMGRRTNPSGGGTGVMGLPVSNPAMIWSYLSQGPLLWLTATLVAYGVGMALFQATGRRPWANPVALAVAVLAPVLWLSETPYQIYFEGAQFVHFMLGPATVALAVPLWGNLALIRPVVLPIAAALIVGALTAMLGALGVAWALGAPPDVLAALAPKSATAPVAIGIAERLGGAPTLAAVLVLCTGITGAIIATPLMNALGLRDWRARGFALGVAAHGIGTARAFQVNETAGAFAGLGMGLNAVLTAILAPILLALFV